MNRSRARILVVDDDLDVRETLADVLSDAGYEVHVAEHGGEALAVLRAARDLPGLILLDLAMPVMDGWQFRAEQRRDAMLAEIPVVTFSARDEHIADAVERLRKPVALSALLEVAARFCGSLDDRPSSDVPPRAPSNRSDGG